MCASTVAHQTQLRRSAGRRATLDGVRVEEIFDYFVGFEERDTSIRVLDIRDLKAAGFAVEQIAVTGASGAGYNDMGQAQLAQRFSGFADKGRGFISIQYEGLY